MAEREFSYCYQAPFGTLTLASDGESLTGLWIRGQKYDGGALMELSSECGKGEELLPVFEETVRWLDLYFSGKEPDFMPPLKTEGSAFRQEVWEILRKIPYGETTTYKKIAEEIAAARGIETMSAQAVGGAVGHNPIGILIPCHRVIGSDGSLTGYAGGLDVKRYLLKLEGICAE